MHLMGFGTAYASFAQQHLFFWSSRKFLLGFMALKTKTLLADKSELVGTNWKVLLCCSHDLNTPLAAAAKRFDLFPAIHMTQ
jgi:hypothetical protein